MKKLFVFPFMLASLLILSGCTAAGQIASAPASGGSTVTLSGTTATGGSAVVSGSTVTVTGACTLTGSWEGRVVVTRGSHVTLDSALLHSSDGAALVLSEGTTLELVGESTLTAGETQGKENGALYAASDLTVTGDGKLTLEGENNGLVCKGNLTLEEGSLTVTGQEHAIVCKGSASVTGGTVLLTGQEDGIHIKSDDTGNLTVTGGELTAHVQGDGISATGDIRIEGGVFTLTTGEGSTASKDETSRKGIKADGAITVTGGSFTLDTQDDCIHAGGSITLADGSFTLRSGDDGVHSDGDVVISGGTITIPACYEGIEGITVTVNGGVLDITSQDDGINAADGSGGNTMGNPNPSNVITVTGGDITIVSGGDSLDSNGDISLSGGTLNLTCNGRGDTAIDCDGSYENTGAEVTTNDGSEENPGGAPGMGMPNGNGRDNRGNGGFPGAFGKGQPPEGSAQPSESGDTPGTPPEGVDAPPEMPQGMTPPTQEGAGEAA